MHFVLLGRSVRLQKKKPKKNHKKSRNRRPWYLGTTLKVNFHIIGLTKGIQFAVKIVPFFLYAVTIYDHFSDNLGRSDDAKREKKRGWP